MRQHIYVVLLLLLLLSACRSGSDAVWQEPFDDVGTWQFASDASADVAIADGHLSIHVLWANQIAWASAGRVYGDFVLTVDATQVSGPADNEYGVLVRMQDNAQFYAFSISGDGYVRVAAYDETDGWWMLGEDWFLSEAVNPGVNTNQLTVEAQGSHYVFRVNEQEVAQVETADVAGGPLKKGDIGLYAGTFSEGDVLITFDDLTVTSVTVK